MLAAYVNWLVAESARLSEDFEGIIAHASKSYSSARMPMGLCFLDIEGLARQVTWTLNEDILSA